MASRLPLAVLLVLQSCIFVHAQNRLKGGASAHKASVPLFRISFEPGEPIRGLSTVPILVLPFECTADGTVFVGMLDPSPIIDPADIRTRFLTSISKLGETHIYRVAAVPDLYDLSEVSHFVSDSQVVFLVRAAREDKRERLKLTQPPGAAAASEVNTAEHHEYIVTFDRRGEHRDTIQIDSGFHTNQVGAFPSGNYLVYGFDETTRLPRLALLNRNGTILKELLLDKNLIRKTAIDDGSQSGTPGLISPVQFVPRGDSLFFVQNKTDLPIIEVGESGNVRVIRPILPKGEKILSLLPSDGNLFVRVSDVQNGSIFEISTDKGELIREFKPGDNEGGHNVACISQGQFLSFQHDWQHGKALIPLFGTPEPISDGSEEVLNQ